jgi:threonylcarbamoyladenosine tRNA methylthiotransferase MtaB
MKISFYTFGCKVNQYESQALSESLLSKGFDILPDNSLLADIFIINSCTVTAESDRKTRQILRRIRNNNPDAVIILTGCFSQAYPKTASSFLEADIINGSKNRTQIPDLIEEFIKNKKRISSVENHTFGDCFEEAHINSFFERTRAFVKIEDGCNRRCSYCIIPTARGFVRSKPLEKIEKEVNTLADNGFIEIVLVGINLSAYGQDIRENLYDAVETVAKIKSIKRIRLGSLEPDLMTDEVIERLSRIDKLCPHFHLSLQSGCDETLKRMNRKYNTFEYSSVVSKLRNIFKECSITTDIMVGFPGETDEDFNSSLEFCKKICFTQVHIFPYSKRPNTPAAQYPMQVTKAIKTKRVHIMQNEMNKCRELFFSNLITTEVNVLFEKGKPSENGNVYEGFTENYIPVSVNSFDNLQGKCYNVLIEDYNKETCFGKII